MPSAMDDARSVSGEQPPPAEKETEEDQDLKALKAVSVTEPAETEITVRQEASRE
jgi:hypothetical protein